MRTFIAIPLPSETIRTISEIQRPLRETAADVRWTAPESIHLTLKFLGEIDPAILPGLAESLRLRIAPLESFSLTLRSIGAFPGARAPRVVCCGIEGDLEMLRQLQTATEEACKLLGFAPEERSFRPHLTLGRVKGKRNLHSLLECIRIGSKLESTFHATQINMYKSTLTPRGSIYDVLESIRMKDVR